MKKVIEYVKFVCVLLSFDFAMLVCDAIARGGAI